MTHHPSRRPDLASTSLRACKHQRGSALLVVMILGSVMAVLFGVVLSYLDRAAKLEKRSNLRLEATYAAEYAFETAFQELRTAISINAVPNIAQTTEKTNLTTAPTGLFTSANGYTWKSYLTVPTNNGLVVDAHPNIDLTRGTYRFLTIVEFDRTMPTMGAPVRAHFQREWIFTLRPLFQYAIFYESNMELFPGAAFVVGGRVHSNGRIHTATSASITFKDFVTSVNGLTNKYQDADPRKGEDANLNGAVTHQKGPASVSAPEDPPGSVGQNTSDSNQNNDGPRELIEIPKVGQTDASAGERLYNKAGLKVLVNTTTSVATSSSSVSVPANSRAFVTADNTVIPATDPLDDYLNTMFGTSDMVDYREGVTVKTTEVNVGNITTGYKAGGLPATIPTTTKWPNDSTVPAALKNKDIPVALRGKALWNGILYVADITDSSSHPVGVKIINGSSLPDGTKTSSPKAGLTIVSENAAYIVGDYNTGGSPPVNSGSDLAASNKVSGYTVQPAAVIADAVTVVSSKWTSSNYNKVGTLNSRDAVNTTINTALISGIVTTTSAAYSGGVENYIRLLEDWGDGKRLTYYGSIINLYASKQATAPWKTTGNYYQAPARNWYFDVGFLDPNKLPPGTPILRSLQRGQWVQLE